jgi:NADH dehydrogenase
VRAPNVFGVPGAEEHAFPLYSVADAEYLRLHLQSLVDGGRTGVEITGALAELTQP